MEKRRCYGCMKLKTQVVCEHCGQDERILNAPHQLPMGTVLRDQYIIGRALGQGGFGITYLGWDRNLEIPVAIKEYFPTGLVMRESIHSLEVTCTEGDHGKRFQSSRERFLREAKALTRFEAVPEIVHVHSFFEENNTAYIVMEYVEGINLRKYVKDKGGKISAEETFRLLKPVMEALSKVHKTGLVHRDISPDNIMLLPNGRTKLIDFGAARDVLNADAENPLSKSTEAILKHGYAPIEQYQKRGSLGPWTDVHALCATIYYCLTGQVPPDAPERCMGDAVVDWKSVTELTKKQIVALEKGMAIYPKDRYQSVEELYAGLFDPNQAEEESKTEPKSEPKTETRGIRGRMVLLGVLLVAAVILCVLIGVNAGKNGGEPSEGAQVQETEDPNSWQDNVLCLYEGYYPDGSGSIYVCVGNGISVAAKNEIQLITFLDTTKNAPEDAYDASENGDGSVLVWLEGEGNKKHLYIAGESGVSLADGTCYSLFFNFANLLSVDFNGCVHTENVTDMSNMFGACKKLQSVDFTGIDTSNVKYMLSMFSECENLQELDLSGFDTSNVEDMSGMFSGCYDLKELDVSHFDTSKVVNLSDMFFGCESFESLDLRNFDTANVTDMHGMFYRCSSLTELNLSSFDTANVTDMSCMFGECSSLYELDLSNFDTSNVTNMSTMFAHCTYLNELDLSSFDTSNVTNMSQMFCGNKNRAWEQCKYLDTSSVTDMRSMFANCENMVELDLSHFNTSKVETMTYMFSDCYNLKTLDLRNFDTSNVTNMCCMFWDCHSLKTLDISSFDTSNVTDMGWMFYNCLSLTEIKVGKFDTSKVTRYTLFMEEGKYFNGRPWESWFT